MSIFGCGQLVKQRGPGYLGGTACGLASPAVVGGVGTLAVCAAGAGSGGDCVMVNSSGGCGGGGGSCHATSCTSCLGATLGSLGAASAEVLPKLGAVKAGTTAVVPLAAKATAAYIGGGLALGTLACVGTAAAETRCFTRMPGSTTTPPAQLEMQRLGTPHAAQTTDQHAGITAPPAQQTMPVRTGAPMQPLPYERYGAYHAYAYHAPTHHPAVGWRA